MNVKDHGIAVRSRAIDMLDAYYCTNILDKTMQRCSFKEAKNWINSTEGYDFKHFKDYFYAGWSTCPHSQSDSAKCSDIFPAFWKRVECQGTLRILIQ